MLWRHQSPAPVESRHRGGNDEPKNYWYLQNEKN